MNADLEEEKSIINHIDTTTVTLLTQSHPVDVVPLDILWGLVPSWQHSMWAQPPLESSWAVQFFLGSGPGRI